MGLQDSIQHLARETVAHQRWYSYAKVLQVDHKRNRAKVELVPYKNQTGFIRIGNLGVGDGWTIHVPIFKNDEVLVAFPNGQLASGIIVHRLHHEEGDDPDSEDPNKFPKRRWPNMDNYLDESDLRRCSYRDIFMLHKSGSYLRFYGEDSKNTKNGLGSPNTDSDIRLHARKRNGKGGILQVRADTRLEIVAPEIRIRTKDGKDTNSYFVLSDWVDFWNNDWIPYFNGHVHIDPGEGTTAEPAPGHPTLPKEQVCDMRTRGQVGYGE